MAIIQTDTPPLPPARPEAVGSSAQAQIAGLCLHAGCTPSAPRLAWHAAPEGDRLQIAYPILNQARCAQCHGPDGLGVGEHFPAISGLNAAYMQNQISAWKTGKRPPGPLQLMSTVAQKLTPDDITAVAAYYARLHGGGAVAAAGSSAPAPATTPQSASSMQGKP